jgi:putative phosphotransacetylase
MNAGQNHNGSLDRQRLEAMVRRVVYDYLPDTYLSRNAGMQEKQAPRLLVNISARHIHLSRQGLDALFGPGYELNVHKELYQEGAFAAKETVTVFGPRKQMIADVRILGPLRDYNQVELAFTDARLLGIDVPVRISGDHRDTPGCYLVGPAGGIELQSGVVRAARHVHMNPDEAAYYGVEAGDRMRLVIDSEQGGALEGLICRVSEQEKLEVHLDTDEGNGMDLVRARNVYLEK